MQPNSRRRMNQPTTSKPMRQLMMLCVMLVLVVMVMSRVRQPGMWTWLTGSDAERSPSEERLGRSATRVDDGGDEIPPGVFVTAAPELAQSSDEDDRRNSVAAGDANGTALGIDASVFEGIQDKTNVLPHRPYFHLLDVARRKTSEQLEALARRDLTFAHFWRTPELFRGEPVFLKGRLGRLTEITPVRNREGFTRLYEGWLFTGESQGNPYVIVMSEVPDEMPLGGDVREAVSFTGLFLKLWKYPSGDGVRVAPLVLGRSVTWHRPPASSAPEPRYYAASLAVVVGLICVLFFSIWWSQRTAASIRRTHDAARLESGTQNADSLKQIVGLSTEEYLTEMERDASKSRSPETDPTRPGPRG